MKKALLFDMDGVLYDSMPNHAIAWQRAMADFGIAFTEADSYATEGARGIDTIRHFVRQQQGRDITLDEAQAMYDVKTRYFHLMPETKIFPGVTDVMRKAADRGMAIGVVTGSGQRPLIERLLRDFSEFLSEDHIVTAYDVKRGKPNADPYLMGLQKCGRLNPSEGVVVENAPLGVEAGVAAGCFTVAINSGPLPDEALSSKGANVVFQTMVEFRDHFDNLFAE